MDALHASVKKGLNLFPAKGKLSSCPKKGEYAEVGMRRLMVDLMVWEFDDHARERQLAQCNVTFQKEVWKKYATQNHGPGQRAP